MGGDGGGPRSRGGARGPIEPDQLRFIQASREGRIPDAFMCAVEESRAAQG